MVYLQEAQNLCPKATTFSNRVSEIRLSVKGRKSGRDIPRPVWFVHESNTLYLLPNYGSDTNWYKNLLVDPTLKISVSGGEPYLYGSVLFERTISAVYGS